MFQKAKGVTGFLAEMSEKAGPLNAMAYAISRGVGAREKRGVPKNAGISDDMYENKGQKNSDRGYPTIYMKTGNLTVISDDIDENKTLNTRFALAQRAILSGFVGNSLFAATRVYLAKRRLDYLCEGAATAGWQSAALRLIPIVH
jgi:hypothetical protein